MTEKGIVFFPDPHLEATPKEYSLGDYEDVFFEASDGTTLHGWFVNGSDDRAVLLWFHGNAGNISHRLENLKMLHHALQIPIFIFDYREYGLSQGEISKKGTFYDADGAFRYLVKERGYKPSSVMLFGRSLGTALVIYLASTHNCLGLVLEAAFTSTDDMMKLYFPLGIPLQVSTTKYNSISLINCVQCPILFIHGELDTTIPVSMARTLYQKAIAEKEFYEVAGADHNDTYLVGGEKYFKVWQEFLERCLGKNR